MRGMIGDVTRRSVLNQLMQKLGVELPIIQAPMAGVSTPEMAAAVSNAGGLGSIGAGSVDADSTRRMIAAVRSLTARPFNVNVFCHRPAVANRTKEKAWLLRLDPEFTRFEGTTPSCLREIYQSFLTDDAKLAVLVAERPAVVSFHFGLPARDKMEALRSAGIALIATVTSIEEGREIAEAGVDAVVAQGYEAGGHRGMFEPAKPDDRLSTIALTRMLVKQLDIPVIAAGGIMDGAGIAAALMLGAAGAQLGTAFIACPESSADAAYRSALLGSSASHTVMMSAISGRPARCLANRFTAIADGVDQQAIPDYPIAYDAGKALHAVAKSAGEFGYGAHWAGQGAPLARKLPAAELVACLRDETEEALTNGAIG